jgi:hypothetical protein
MLVYLISRYPFEVSVSCLVVSFEVDFKTKYVWPPSITTSTTSDHHYNIHRGSPLSPTLITNLTTINYHSNYHLIINLTTTNHHFDHIWPLRTEDYSNHHDYHFDHYIKNQYFKNHISPYITTTLTTTTITTN